MLRQKYSLPSDLWSAGIIAYQLITGWLPFAGEEGDEVSTRYMETTQFDRKVCDTQRSAGKSQKEHVVLPCGQQSNSDCKLSVFQYEKRVARAQTEVKTQQLIQLCKPVKNMPKVDQLLLFCKTWHCLPVFYHSQQNSELLTGSAAFVMVCIITALGGELSSDVQEVFRAVLYADLDFERAPWDSVSPECKDLVQSLLHRTPESRPTAVQALQHRYACASLC